MSTCLENVLLPGEVEFYIKSVEPSQIESLGTKSWFDGHQRLQKLHQQAVLEAQENREEAVKEMIISYNKIPVLVYEAVCVSVWREKVLPELLKVEPEPKTAFLPYIVLHHEATAIAFLETVLYHSDSCEALEDTSLELIDYCVFATTKLIAQCSGKHMPAGANSTTADELENISDMAEALSNETALEQLKRQQTETAYQISIRCISILGYIARNLESLPLSATSRIFSIHDVPMLLSNLLEKAPWTKTDASGKTFQHREGQWQAVPDEEETKLTKSEGQVWLALRQLLLDPRCAAHYDFSEFRRDQLVRLQRLLNDTVLDQLSLLVDLRHWLAQLAAITPPASSRRPLIMEVMPQIRQSLLKKSSKQWKALAQQHAKLMFHCSQQQMAEIATGLSETYNLDTLEALATQLPPCDSCGESSRQRCSRCKARWYCSRQCQVKEWGTHKEICDWLVNKQKHKADCKGDRKGKK